MSEFYDRYETRAPKSRESAFFRDIRAILKIAQGRAPALRRQLKSVNLDCINKRSDLAQIPLMRKSDQAAMQCDAPPFGGLTTVRASHFKRVLVAPGPIFIPEGEGKDWWGAARALYAAGLRKGDLLLNGCSSPLAPNGHMIESGAQALSCTTIPAVWEDIEQRLGAICRLRPRVYCGSVDFFKRLRERALANGDDISSIKSAIFFDAPPSEIFRQELNAAGVAVRQIYATPELGVIAYESCAGEGLIVNEGCVVEIIRPDSGELAPEGEIGEVVVTRLNSDFPLLRFATGDLSAVLPGLSPCGRTNMRLRGWLGPAH